MVACGGLKLCTNITASADDSCSAHLLDVGFIHDVIMCLVGECWFFASVTTNCLDLSHRPFLSISGLTPALGLYLDVWKTWDYSYLRLRPLEISFLSHSWILRLHSFVIRGLIGWEGVLAWKMPHSWMLIACRSRHGIQMVVVTAQIVCSKQWPREFNKIQY